MTAERGAGAKRTISTWAIENCSERGADAKSTIATLTTNRNLAPLPSGLSAFLGEVMVNYDVPQFSCR